MTNPRAIKRFWSIARFSLLVLLAVFMPMMTSSVRSSPLLSPPYPPSPVITDIVFDWSTHKRHASGSDNWPVTWADDDHQYTSWGDGGGFGGTNSDGRVSLGIARVEGPWDNYSGYNVWGGKNGANPAQFSGKSYGIVSVDGVLYMWVGPGSNTVSYDEARIARSTDRGATWLKASWAFLKSTKLIMPTILQFGKDYAGARDGYVYSYFIRLQGNPSSLGVHKPGMIDLARVPKDKIMDQASYEFFAGLDAGGSPRWTSDQSLRQPVFQNPEGVGWTVAVSYNQGLKRYILTTEHTESFKGNLGIFDAPEPWGPWTTVAYYTNWSASTFFWNFSNKWLSSDGKSFTLIYTGLGSNDSWNTVRGSFSTNIQADSTPTASPTSTQSPTPIPTPSPTPNATPTPMQSPSPTPTPTPAPGTEFVISDLTVASGKAYQVVKDGLSSGAKVYIDRSYSFTSVPSTLTGATYIKTANDDKNRTDQDFLSFSVNHNVTVYVAYNATATSLPNWLSSWKNTNQTLGTTDRSLKLYSKELAQGTISLGGNLAAGASSAGSNYTVVVVGKMPSQPEPTPTSTPNPSPTPLPTATPTSTPTSSPTPAPLVISAQSAEVEAGKHISVVILLDRAPTGLAGFNLKATLSGTTVARFTDAQFPAFGLTQNELLSDGEIHLQAVDTTGIVKPGATNVTLATLSVEGLRAGSTSVVLSVNAVDDDAGNSMSVHTVPGMLKVLNIVPVVEAGPDVIIKAGESYQGIVNITDPGDSSWAVEVDYGDGSVAQQLRVESASFTLTHTYDKVGEYMVQIVVKDEADAEGSDNLRVKVEVVYPALPGMAGPAQDLDGDGLAEDVNGNGRLDFADVVTLFDHMDSEEVRFNQKAFDFNGNGHVDFDDIIRLFELLVL